MKEEIYKTLTKLVENKPHLTLRKKIKDKKRYVELIINVDELAFTIKQKNIYMDGLNSIYEQFIAVELNNDFLFAFVQRTSDEESIDNKILDLFNELWNVDIDKFRDNSKYEFDSLAKLIDYKAKAQQKEQ